MPVLYCIFLYQSPYESVFWSLTCTTVPTNSCLNKAIEQTPKYWWHRTISIYFTHRLMGQLGGLFHLFYVLSRLGRRRQGEALLKVMELPRHKRASRITWGLLNLGSKLTFSIYIWPKHVTWPSPKSEERGLHSMHYEMMEKMRMQGGSENTKANS